MTSAEAKKPKIVVLTGAGISAPSGLATFRNSNGLWHQYRIEDVATPEAWERRPEVVLQFYNERRKNACAATPNAGHYAVATLEGRFDVIVVTQNVDDLHERAGSTQVIHLHGELIKARSTADPALIYNIGSAPIRMGDHCEKGSQLRPHIVWFGEDVQRFEEALEHVRRADKILVIGTSLTVFPAASLVDYAPPTSEKVFIDPEPDRCPRSFRVLRGSADTMTPGLVAEWLK